MSDRPIKYEISPKLVMTFHAGISSYLNSVKDEFERDPIAAPQIAIAQLMAVEILRREARQMLRAQDKTLIDSIDAEVQRFFDMKKGLILPPGVE